MIMTLNSPILKSKYGIQLEDFDFSKEGYPLTAK